VDIQIETGILMPKKPAPGGRYPFAKMNVGDSFVVKLEGRKSWGFAFALINSAQRKFEGRKFTSRLLDADTRRVWRVA
jgi:hypothetical protein